MKTHISPRFCIAVLAAVLCSFGLNAQGPNAPEAGSFEPVDATDMVSLITGDLTYVLPLMNVPSPEGGYPIALAYHAGIALDQEASWTGLGWNLNPGAINRMVNGYPDDYKNAIVSEYFFDRGGEEIVYTASIGFGFANGLSIGLGASWGSNKSLGGFVSIGVGPKSGSDGYSGGVTIGSDGVGFNLGHTAGGLSLGVNANSEGTIGGTFGKSNTNGVGFSVGANNRGSVYANSSFASNSDQVSSIGISFSSSGVGVNLGIRNKTRNQASKLSAYGGGGIGINLSYNSSMVGNYSLKSSGWTIPIITPWGVSAAFGMHKFSYILSQKIENNIFGPLYYNSFITSKECEYKYMYGGTSINFWINCEDKLNPKHVIYYTSEKTGKERLSQNAFMDIYGISVENRAMKSLNLEESNLVFPSYDNYNVQAQGLSGRITPRIYENKALKGISNKRNSSFYLSYGYQDHEDLDEIPEHLQFQQFPEFVFENEITSYTGVSKVNYVNSDVINGSLKINFKQDIDQDGIIDLIGKQKASNFIKYYTVGEVSSNRSNDFFKPIVQDIYKSSEVNDHMAISTSDAIEGFQITSVDGVTYHYSLPVYNFEIISRTTGMIKNAINRAKIERDSYFEKRQLTPFATHWLLTAITGPDFVDNGDNVVGEEDLGYWISFEYGKWSDAFVWNTLSKDGLEYFKSEADPSVHTWIKGRKEVYYLNKVKTRTHSALFVKSINKSIGSPKWSYSSIEHKNVNKIIEGDELTEDEKIYKHNFTIESQHSLKLDKIMLFKNQDIKDFDLKSDNSSPDFVEINYPGSNFAEKKVYFNLFENIIDTNDEWDNLVEKSIKTIDLTYSNKLLYPIYTDSGDSSLTAFLSEYNRLTLESVSFNGKGGNVFLPPYRFAYNDIASISKKERNNFGYYTNDNSLASLTQIKTPQGSNINIKYEEHQYVSATPHGFIFSTNNIEFNILKPSISYDLLLSAEIKSAENIGIKVGDRLTATVDLDVKESVYLQTGTHSVYRNRKIDLRVTEKIDDNHFKVASLEPILYPSEFYSNNGGLSVSDYSLNVKNILFTSNENTIYTGGGPRVASISIEDGKHQISTRYTYGTDQNSIGYISYIPRAPNLENEVPFSAELPVPKVLYEYTRVDHLDSNGISQGSTQYYFNVLKSKDPDKIKYEDFYEILVDKKQNVANNINKQIRMGDFTVKDAIASIGQLLSVTSFNKEGQITNEVQNEYFSPSDSPNQLGIKQESFQSYKNLDLFGSNLKDIWIIGSSTRIRYPSLLKKTISTTKNQSIESLYQDFNPITGFAETVLTKDYKGNQIKSTSLPAYKAYPGSYYGMGSKYDDSTNKNMLSQTAQTATYIEKNGEWKPLSVGISTWKKWDPEHFIDGKDLVRKQVWRKHQTYVWDGPLDADGTYASFEGTDDQFNWTSETQTNPRWRAVQTTTRYDAFSKPLEQRDINNNYTSIHRGDGDTKTLAVVNAPYTAYACHGFEYNRGFSGGSQTSKKAHTGSYGLEINQGSPEVSIVSIGGKYQLSVWVEKGKEAELRVSENGTLKELNGETITAGEWVQRTHYLDLDSGSASIGLSSASGSMIIDDFRLLPISSQATTYVYNQWDELSYVLGANNMATHYTYTPSGKLEATATEVADAPGLVGGFKKTTQHQYNYKNALE